MASGVNLYNGFLFGNCYESSIIKTFNNAPGLSPGDEAKDGRGIDDDAAARIGFKNISTNARVGGSNKNRVQGICCGITASWMVALLGGNADATDHKKFKDFFMGPLRFQGAYVRNF